MFGLVSGRVLALTEVPVRLPLPYLPIILTGPEERDPEVGCQEALGGYPFPYLVILWFFTSRGSIPESPEKLPERSFQEEKE